MTEESKRIEYWNFLIGEKNQPRPKGLTVHRLAVIKPLLIAQSDLWNRVIELHGAAAFTATEFYQSGEMSAVRSRTDFWDAVRGFLLREDRNRIAQDEPSKRRRQKTDNRNNGKNNRKRADHSTIQEDIIEGNQIGVAGTPSAFLLNNKTGDARIKIGLQLPSFKAEIDKMLE